MRVTRVEPLRIIIRGSSHIAMNLVDVVAKSQSAFPECLSSYGMPAGDNAAGSGLLLRRCLGLPWVAAGGPRQFQTLKAES
jgi:hypothetical protein